MIYILKSIKWYKLTIQKPQGLQLSESLLQLAPWNKSLKIGKPSRGRECK